MINPSIDSNLTMLYFTNKEYLPLFWYNTNILKRSVVHISPPRHVKTFLKHCVRSFSRSGVHERTRTRWLEQFRVSWYLDTDVPEEPRRIRVDSTEKKKPCRVRSARARARVGRTLCGDTTGGLGEDRRRTAHATDSTDANSPELSPHREPLPRFGRSGKDNEVRI